MMLDAVSHMGVVVRDQDEAKAFYTEKLGFEVREDATLDALDGYRWLTVGAPGQPEFQLILEVPAPPAYDEEASAQMLEMAARGAMPGGIFHTEDCRGTCKELEARGVEIISQPDERFYGIDASFRDPSGNLFRIVQPIEFDIEAMQRAQSQ